MIVAEILGPDGATLSRVKLEGTCVVGTDRSCGLVLVDPTVAPRHLELREGPGGGAALLRRLSDDGETRVGSLVVGTEAEVTLPTTLSVGAITLRLSRAAADAAAEVPPPSPTTSGAARSRAAKAWGLCLAAVVLFAGRDFLTTYKAHPWHEALVMAVGILFLLPAWAGGWTVGNRLFGYRNRFYRHLSAVSVWGLVAALVGLVTTSATEIVHTDATRMLGTGVDALLFAWLLYLHIRVASRWRARTNTLVAGAIVLAVGSLALLPSDTDADEPVKAALSTLTPLPATLYVTRPVTGLSASADKILRELNGMQAKQSVKQAPESP